MQPISWLAEEQLASKEGCAPCVFLNITFVFAEVFNPLFNPIRSVFSAHLCMFLLTAEFLNQTDCNSPDNVSIYIFTSCPDSNPRSRGFCELSLPRSWEHARSHASTAVWLRYSLFWCVTQRRLIVVHRRFGTYAVSKCRWTVTNLCCVQTQRRGFSRWEDGT